MTLDELDKLAAEKVMGWRLAHGVWYETLELANGPDEVFKMSHNYWKPTKDIKQAWELLEKIKGTELFFWSISHGSDINSRGLWECTAHDKYEVKYFCAIAETAHEAITRACLKSCGEEL